MAENKRLSVPGPGTYRAVDGLTNDGKYVVSRFKDSGASAMRSTAERWLETEKFKKTVPGPGRYEMPNTINEGSKNFVSKLESGKSWRFPLAPRASVVGPKKCT